MKNLPVVQPSFLPQPCPLPPLLVSENDAGRLLALGRSQVKRLIAEGVLRRVEVGGGLSRVTMASIVAYVERLAGEWKEPAASGTAGESGRDDELEAAGRPPTRKNGGSRAPRFYLK